jgi:hypothetical protein
LEGVIVRWCIGFDLSLSAPAAVALPLDWTPGDWARCKSWLGKPPTPKNQDDLRGQLDRYDAIASWAVNAVRETLEWQPATTELDGFVEAYGFSKNNASASRIMESGGVVKMRLYEKFGLVLTPVTSSETRKLLLGFNPRKPKYDAKVVIQDALFNRAGAPKTWDDNQCDAFAVANFGLSNLGSVAMMVRDAA